MKLLPYILLIEDHQPMIDTLTEATRNDYVLDAVQTGKLGIHRTDREQYDVIILDLNLEDMHGADVCQQLRERDCKTPMLVLSAESGASSKIRLLDAGANDYLVKPFSLGELKARVRVLMRDATRSQPIASYNFSELELNTATREVRRAGTTVNLRRKEFALLERLIMEPGIVIPRSTLTEHAWEDSLGTPWTNTIDVHIKYLRDKIDRPFGSPMIQTVHGIGYKLVAAQTADVALAPT